VPSRGSRVANSVPREWLRGTPFHSVTLLNRPTNMRAARFTDSAGHIWEVARELSSPTARSGTS